MGSPQVAKAAVSAWQDDQLTESGGLVGEFGHILGTKSHWGFQSTGVECLVLRSHQRVGWDWNRKRSRQWLAVWNLEKWSMEEDMSYKARCDPAEEIKAATWVPGLAAVLLPGCMTMGKSPNFSE